MVHHYRTYLEQQGTLVNAKFDYTAVNILNESIQYKEITAKHIVFAEGFGLKENPFFNHLPLTGVKGETINIHAPNLKIDFQLKSSVFVLPLGNDQYKIGATFNWLDKTSTPTREGLQELEEKLQKVITVPYTIIEHTAGVRPTTKDRRPLVGVHHLHKNLFVLNGLGTRGVMIAPSVAKSLYNYISQNKALPLEIDIKRFD